MFRTIGRRVGLVAILLGTIGAMPANGQTVCGEYKSIVNQLAAQYGEVPRGVGLVSHQQLMEIYVSPKDASWTILIVHSEGPTCVVATGEAWQSIPEDFSDEEVPS